MAEAERFFGTTLSRTQRESRKIGFTGTVGTVTVSVGMEGGHYTRITVQTDQVGESELDKLAKRFLGVVHTKAEPEHALRGSY
ncbi:MAG: hypothetical protein HY700_22130 [Gemmatimonadetes bacterium]|nr:hypothetical protein [Gemmatimonadota bacterium]